MTIVISFIAASGFFL